MRLPRSPRRAPGYRAVEECPPYYNPHPPSSRPSSYETACQQILSLPEIAHTPEPRNVNNIRNIHVTYNDPGLLSATAAAGALGMAIHPPPRVPVRERSQSLPRLEFGRTSATMWRERRSTSQRCHIAGCGIIVMFILLFAIIYAAV